MKEDDVYPCAEVAKVFRKLFCTSVKVQILIIIIILKKKSGKSKSIDSTQQIKVYKDRFGNVLIPLTYAASSLTGLSDWWSQYENTYTSIHDVGLFLAQQPRGAERDPTGPLTVKPLPICGHRIPISGSDENIATVWLVLEWPLRGSVVLFTLGRVAEFGCVRQDTSGDLVTLLKKTEWKPLKHVEVKKNNNISILSHEKWSQEKSTVPARVKQFNERVLVNGQMRLYIKKTNKQTDISKDNWIWWNRWTLWIPNWETLFQH